ncbi:hypothetical protein [Paenibacillus cymbidii]|uniref:hypothetical protein n=1 Tax=Paenibacillus cymbidii TaxID=1639034 RepID=UPI001080D6B6|nr:hypothetical protein [Paenibacillus cymbidii]
MKRWGLAMVVVLGVVLTACSDKKEQAASAYKPTLDVIVTVNGTSATVEVKTDMKISKDHLGMQRMEGQGHIHMYMDDGEKTVVSDPTVVFGDLKQGKHQVKVSLHNNDHTPYDVNKSVNFEIK